MTVNEVVENLQMMINKGIITGKEPFGYFAFAGYGDPYFDESSAIRVENNWEESGNVVYIE